jgi:dihydroflavonol-4-reductase
MILVTGGTGLLGSHLLYELASGRQTVRAIKRASSHTGLVRQLFTWYDPDHGDALFSRIEWVDGDINDIISLEEALNGITHVYHCAAVVSFLPDDRQRMMHVNVEGTANLVNLCLKAKITKLCHCSSVAAIGKPDRGNQINENLVWKTSPSNSWYAISKYGAEREVWRAGEEGLSSVIVNPTVVIGPGDPTRSSAQLYQSVKNGMKFYTTGVTGFVDARDVARAMVLLMDSKITGQRFIISSENLSYKKLFELFAHYAGVKPPALRANLFMTEMAWRLEKMRSFITGQKPLLSKETSRNANVKRYFSSDKFIKATNFHFRTIAEATENTSLFFQKHPVYLSPDFRI